MTWQLTALTAADRDLILGCLRTAADGREKVAKESSLRLVTDGEEGRTLPVKAQRAVRQLHAEADTLRAFAWEMEHQPDMPAPAVASVVVEEERAATYPALAAVEPSIGAELAALAEEAETTRDADIDYVRSRPRKAVKRAVKLVEYRDETDERAAAMAAHPSSQTRPQEDQS